MSRHALNAWRLVSRSHLSAAVDGSFFSDSPALPWLSLKGTGWIEGDWRLCCRCCTANKHNCNCECRARHWARSYHFLWCCV